jgi:hypothetical protein
MGREWKKQLTSWCADQLNQLVSQQSLKMGLAGVLPTEFLSIHASANKLLHPTIQNSIGNQNSLEQ